MFTVVAASAAGTAFEWYDFFIFGSLTQVISRAFFAGLNDTAGTLAALALFGVGFAFRPIGALVFGAVGDRLGRKGAFLVTVSLMGGATFAIGFLPTYAQAGIAAPLLLIALRVIQGFALGGEYGGAVIYVAEHAKPNERGWMTSWVQTSAAFGLFGALGVILTTRTLIGEAAFADWGWRVPFMVSAGLLAISVWMRVKLSESPAFTLLKAEGGATKAPYADAFGNWPSLKLVFLAFFSMMSAQGAVWYCSFFYVQVFMEKFLKVDPATINLLMMAAVAASAPLYVFFGWLSDIIGRKIVMLGGMSLALVAFFPGFHALERAANPALAEASARTPVVVIADPADCSLQFDLVGKAAFVSSCDIAKSFLANAGVSYENQAAPAGSIATVKIGGVTVIVDQRAGAAQGPGQAGQDRGRRPSEGGAESRWLSGQGRPRRPQLRGHVRHPDGLRGRRHRPVRPPGRLPGRAVPDQDPLHRHVAALQYRHGLDRRLPADHRLRHRRSALRGRHLRRPLVSGAVHRRQRGGDAGLLPARDRRVVAAQSGGDRIGPSWTSSRDARSLAARVIRHELGESLQKTPSSSSPRRL